MGDIFWHIPDFNLIAIITKVVNWSDTDSVTLFYWFVQLLDTQVPETGEGVAKDSPQYDALNCTNRSASKHLQSIMSSLLEVTFWPNKRWILLC